jgi:diguanylate cyclase (GGDEF)-like protein
MVSNPLERLVEASNELEKGHWPEAVSTTRQDEIGGLERAFDSMVGSIKSSRERLLQMVDIDPLTELLNYRSFRRAVEDATDSNDEVWIAIADIDGFEAYNQEFGHDAGDDLLVDIGRLIRASFDESATIARYSGNQFAVCAGPESELVLQQIRRKVRDQYPVTLSIGLAQKGEANGRTDLLLLSAQLAVGQAKASGKNRVRLFDGFGSSVTDGDLSFLRQSSYAAVRALAEAVDAKDEYTRGHSQRVAEYARDLAARCGYDSGFVDLVFVTGTLHDVGKIGVPDAALKKPGKLTDEEFEMIKIHPALGEKIVSQIPELADTIPGIRSHHERYDGRGYPDRLAGEQIPLIGRILAVADTYDAMTSDRPYRKGLDPSIAFEAIINGKGTQFDPEFAEQFVAMMTATQSERAA